MIPEVTITRVRESVDIVELVRENVVGLKKAGRNYQARCPFHQERTPSFSVNPEMGLFKCFGCGVGGDAFKFVMLMEGLNYPDAIHKLAARVGITIEESLSPAESAEAKERKVIYGLMEDAARFYHRHLLESSEAAEARAYLEKRGVTQESMVRFCLGFAPASGQAIKEAASRKGWDVNVLEKAGLLRRKEGSGRVFDHFWSRIIFPIWDTHGRIVAFGGRAMGDAMPKYINSPETPVYSKSRHLYGLFQGMPALRKARQVVILEGYMDVVVCHQFGFEWTAATLGTALTEDHVRLLRRYSDKVTLLFDPDAAGAAASLRGGELLMADGFTVGVVTLPDDVDPDELLVKEGKASLEKYLEEPVPFMDYYLVQMRKKYPGASPESKLAIAREILPLIKKMRDPLLQDEHLGRLAQSLQVEKNVLGQQMKKIKTDQPRGTEIAAKTGVKPASTLLSLEEEMLLLALLHPSEEMATSLDSVSWTDERCKQIWSEVNSDVARATVQVSALLPTLPEDAQQWLTHLTMQPRQYPHPQDTLKELMMGWNRQQESNSLKMMKAEIDSMIEGKSPMDPHKVQAYNDLSKRLKGSRAVSH
jgi:DNA primase